MVDEAAHQSRAHHWLEPGVGLRACRTRSPRRPPTSLKCAGPGLGVGDRGRRHRVRTHWLCQRGWGAARCPRGRDSIGIQAHPRVFRIQSATSVSYWESRRAVASTAPGPWTTWRSRGRCSTLRSVRQARRADSLEPVPANPEDGGHCHARDTHAVVPGLAAPCHRPGQSASALDC